MIRIMMLIIKAGCVGWGGGVFLVVFLEFFYVFFRRGEEGWWFGV